MEDERSLFLTELKELKVLEYSDYRYFEDVARRAYIACKNSGINPDDHFVVNNEMVQIGSNAESIKRLENKQKRLDAKKGDSEES